MSNTSTNLEKIMRLAAEHAHTIRSGAERLASEALACNGSFVTCGVGTSSFGAMKLAHLLACYGIKSTYRDALELGHGQLGALSREDSICGFSLSGRTTELVPIFRGATSLGCRTVAITGDAGSPLATESNTLILFDYAVGQDPDHGVAVVSSALASLLISETCAVVSVATTLSSESLLRHHPLGNVGTQLKSNS